MGILKTITEEYFGDTVRKEDEININIRGVVRKDFKDISGKRHKNGFYVSSGNKTTLQRLIVTIIEQCGSDCDLNCIDVSNVKDMSDLIRYIPVDFNCDISHWNVSNVKNMSNMFFRVESFNKPIGDWDVSSVTNMNGMFYYAKSFNQPIGDWDVSNVKNMHSMFNDATSFNQPIGNWNVSNVTDISWMFNGAQSFCQSLDKWEVKSCPIYKTEYIFKDSPMRYNPPEWYKKMLELYHKKEG